MGGSFAIDRRDRAFGHGMRHSHSSNGISPDALCAELSGQHHPAVGLHSDEMARVRNRQKFVLARLVGAIDPGHAEGIATKLLERFGSLGGIFAASQPSIALLIDSDELAALLTMAKDAVLESMREDVRRVLFDASDGRILKYLIATMQGEKEEHLHAIFLDSRRCYLKDERVASGGWTQITIKLRPLLRRAIELNSAQIVLFHNHPSGVAEPSHADIAFTCQASSAAKAIGIDLLDHLIVAGPSVFSMRLAGMMP